MPVMSSGTKSSGAENLFACTSCHGKFSFEQLSHGEQLCKGCRKLYPRVQCQYCHLDYHKMKSTDKRNTCRSCYHDYKTYGEPLVCEYCKLRAAFKGTKCNRCRHSESRYGTPVSCEHCLLQCAFVKQDHVREKVDGKTLCLMCTLSYKKTRYLTTANKRTNDSRDASPDCKKARLSTVTETTNDITTFSLTDSQSESLSTIDRTVEVEELRNQVYNLKKQLSSKEQLILEKEKQICQLRAEGWEQVKELRHKLQTQQRTHTDLVDSLQGNIRQLQKQLSQQSTKTSRPPAVAPSNKDGIFNP